VAAMVVYHVTKIDSIEGPGWTDSSIKLTFTVEDGEQVTLILPQDEVQKLRKALDAVSNKLLP
jgi:hypothetical protein